MNVGERTIKLIVILCLLNLAATVSMFHATSSFRVLKAEISLLTNHMVKVEEK